MLVLLLAFWENIYPWAVVLSGCLCAGRNASWALRTYLLSETGHKTYFSRHLPPTSFAQQDREQGGNTGKYVNLYNINVVVTITICLYKRRDNLIFNFSYHVFSLHNSIFGSIRSSGNVSVRSFIRFFGSSLSHH